MGRGNHTLLFAGQYEDTETGLVYNRYRYYNPHSGTYTSQDPLGISPNPATAQGYVINPLTAVDIFGLYSCEKSIKSAVEKPYRSGSYYKLDTVRHDGTAMQRHHLVSQDTLRSCKSELKDAATKKVPSKHTPRHAPAIQMPFADHKDTASWGASGLDYRNTEAIMVREGRFDEALSMGIADVQEKFGDKYDDALYEAWWYYKEGS